MARRVHRRGRKRASPRRRRRARRNYAASGLIANPRRKRRSYRRRTRLATNPRHHRRRRRTASRLRGRRHYRRNPALMGFTLPPMDAVLWTGVGLVIPPIMTSMVMGYLPADWKSSKAAYYGVKVASVLVPSMLVRRFVSQRAGNLMLIGGAASFVIDLVREFAPRLLPGATIGAQPFLGNGMGFYERMPSRIPAGNGMGRYTSMPVRSQAMQRTPLLSATPERLSPQSRF